MVKLDGLLLRNDYKWLSYGQEPLPIFSWEKFLIHCLRHFTNIYIRTKGRDICAFLRFFLISSIRIKAHWRQIWIIQIRHIIQKNILTKQKTHTEDLINWMNRMTKFNIKLMYRHIKTNKLSTEAMMITPVAWEMYHNTQRVT